MSAFFKKSKKRKKLEKAGLATSKTRLKQDQTISHVINKSKFISFLILGLVWAFSAALLIMPNKQSLEFYLVEKQLAPKTIYSSFNFIYLDKRATELKQERAKNSVPIILEIEPEKCANSLTKASDIFNIISSATANVDKSLRVKLGMSQSVASSIRMIFKSTDKRQMLREKLSSILYRGVVSPDLIKQFSDKQKVCIIDKVKKHYREAIDLEQVYTPESAAKAFANIVMGECSPSNRKLMDKVIYKLAQNFIQPNLSYNSELTELERKIVSNSAKNNVYKEVKKGDVILVKGEKVTVSVLEKFAAYEKEKNRRNIYYDFWETFIYNLVISLLIVTVTGLYFYYLYPRIFHSNQKMGITATVIIISLICVFFADQLFQILSSEYNLPLYLTSCLLPLGLTAVLLSVLTGVRAATFSSLLVALVVAIKYDSCYIVILGMAVSCIAGYIVANAKNYKRYFLKTVIVVSVIYIIVETFVLLNVLIHDPAYLIWILVFSICNGLATGVISLSLLFVIESVFQVTTDMNLLSLCDYNHPLLKRLQLEAPGTYHHSLIVATLAEQAADAIGANALRTRVYALFHDIGKLSKPDYFTENNAASSARHFSLKPAMSSMVILNHVKEGVNLAITHKLGNKICDAIQQHHGTDLVYFFYRKALEESDGKNRVSETEYRYSGPKPKEKEIAILSIADACEAASRSLSKPTPSKIETLVWEIIRKRIREGQLDNADLTFGELAKVKESIIKTLNSMLHTRVSYPTEEENNNEGDLFKAAKESLKHQEKNV